MAGAIHRARLFCLVDKLPEDQRRVVTLRLPRRKVFARSPMEIGRSEGAVKQLQFRGLQNLHPVRRSRRSQVAGMAKLSAYEQLDAAVQAIVTRFERREGRILRAGADARVVPLVRRRHRTARSAAQRISGQD